MESYFGSPWDFGTGFGVAPSFAPGAIQPVQPQLPGWPGVGFGDNPDPAGQFAAGLAAQGIRPQQFFSDPSIAQDIFKPSMTPSPWDATPVSTPGGPPVTLPQGGAPLQAGGPVAEAQAAGTPQQAEMAKGRTPAEKFVETLKGAKMPTPPTPQKVGTPPPPRPHGQVKAGELLSLLLAQQPAGAQAGLKLPPTLGTSLAGMFR